MRRFSILIVAFFITFSIIGPHTVVEKNVENWNNVSYWKYNPIGVPPEWYGYLVGLPKTEWLRGTYQNGSFVYYYNFHYSKVPQNILIIPNTTRNLKIVLVDPRGKEYNLWNGIVSGYLNLATLSSSIIDIARDKCNPKPTWSQLLFHNPLRVIFSKPGTDCVFNFIPLKGTYKIIITGTFGRLNRGDEPKVRVLGLSYGRLGTDVYGRDIWTGYAYGARETIEVSVLGAGILALLALIMGALSAVATNLGKPIDVTSRILTSIPPLPLAVVLVLIFGRIKYGVTPLSLRININPYAMAFIVAIVFLGTSSREIRSIVKEELKKDYIESSRAIGATQLQIVRFHVLPVLVPYVVYLFAISVPGIIGFITLLGFFNVIPGFNWGTMMSTPLRAGITTYVPYWWEVVPLGLSLGLVAYAFIDIGRLVESKFFRKA